MKISELIELLSKERDEHGDAEVVMDVIEGVWDVKEVCYVDKGWLVKEVGDCVVLR